MEIRDPELDFHLAVRILDAFNTLVANLLVPRSLLRGSRLSEVKSIDCVIPRLSLMSGSYSVDVVCKEAGRLVDHCAGAARFDVAVSEEVARETANIGVLHVPAEWTVEPRMEP